MEAKIIIELIQRFWKPLLIFVVLGGGYLYISHLHNTVENLEIKLQNEKVRADLCEEGRKALKSSIDTQNESIKKWMEAGKDASDKAMEAAKNAAATSAKYNKLVNDIRNSPKPVGCEASIKYLRDGIPELKWEKK